MSRDRDTIVALNADEAKAVKAWLLDLSFGEPEKPLVDAGWSDEEIAAVMESVGRKFNLKWDA